MDRLLEDASGIAVRRAVHMYDAALRANLAQGVVKILPWSLAVPQDPWQKIG